MIKKLMHTEQGAEWVCWLLRLFNNLFLLAEQGGEGGGLAAFRFLFLLAGGDGLSANLVPVHNLARLENLRWAPWL